MNLTTMIQGKKRILTTDPIYDTFVREFILAQDAYDLLEPRILAGEHEDDPSLLTEYQALRQVRNATLKFARENAVFKNYDVKCLFKEVA